MSEWQSISGRSGRRRTTSGARPGGTTTYAKTSPGVNVPTYYTVPSSSGGTVRPSSHPPSSSRGRRVRSGERSRRSTRSPRSRSRSRSRSESPSRYEYRTSGKPSKRRPVSPSSGKPPRGSWKTIKSTDSKGKTRGVNSEYLRVPEGGKLHLPPGTIAEVVNASYRMEDNTRHGIHKDVTHVIAKKVHQGGLDLRVENAALGVTNDPHPNAAKVLVVTYVPQVDRGLTEMIVPEGAMFQLPEGAIDTLLSAEYKLNYEESSGHGWSTDVTGPLWRKVQQGGIRAFLVSRESLQIPYDPFPGRAKVLKIQYLRQRRHAVEWGSVAEDTAWGVREVDETAGARPEYDPRGDVYYRGGRDHVPGVVASQGTDTRHVHLLEAITALLQDVETYGVANEKRLRTVEHLLGTVKADRNNRLACAAGRVVSESPRAPFWSDPVRVLTKMGFSEPDSVAAMQHTGSLPNAAQHLSHRRQISPVRPQYNRY